MSVLDKKLFLRDLEIKLAEIREYNVIIRDDLFPGKDVS